MLEMFRVDGQVAVVTGAGRGLGAATAIGLAEAGADVVISSRTASDLSLVAKQIEEHGRRAIIVEADLSDIDAVTGLAQAAKDELGRLDIVVNNVGGTMPCTFMDNTLEMFEEAFHFNVTTAFALTKAAVPYMLENGGGSVVNISSMMGRAGGRGFISYGTAKGGLAQFTRLAARDLSPKIRVNGIFVGSIATSALEIIVSNDDLREGMESATPLGRIGHPDEIAATVLYLASKAGGYVTGKMLEVDGGIQEPNFAFELPDL
jgi:7-alpha-hydroxysteroid dehydrogenase